MSDTDIELEKYEELKNKIEHIYLDINSGVEHVVNRYTLQGVMSELYEMIRW